MLEGIMIRLFLKIAVGIALVVFAITTLIAWSL